MDEPSPAAPATAPGAVGETLHAARERQGLSLAEIASRTRVPLRHLQAIELGDYAGLPSNTYATGFVKAYARAVGVDEVAITRQLRGELARLGPRTPEYQPYEPPDPARVPSRGLAIVTAGLALALIVLVGLWYGSGLFGRGAPAIVAAAPEAAVGAPVAPPRPAASSTPAASAAAPLTGGQVTLTTTDRVWLRVHDGAKTLYLGTMAPGDHFDVPATAADPLVDVGRPDKLRVALNGAALPPLPASAKPLKDLRVGAAAVAARQAGAVAPVAASTPAASAVAPAEHARPSGPHRMLTETQRANLQSARQLPAPAATP